MCLFFWVQDFGRLAEFPRCRRTPLTCTTLMTGRANTQHFGVAPYKHRIFFKWKKANRNRNPMFRFKEAINICCDLWYRNTVFQRRESHATFSLSSRWGWPLWKQPLMRSPRTNEMLYIRKQRLHDTAFTKNGDDIIGQSLLSSHFARIWATSRDWACSVGLLEYIHRHHWLLGYWYSAKSVY